MNNQLYENIFDLKDKVGRVAGGPFVSLPIGPGSCVPKRALERWWLL